MSLSATKVFQFAYVKSGAGVTGKSGSISVTVYKHSNATSSSSTKLTSGIGSVTEVNSTDQPGLYKVGVSGLDPTFAYTVCATYTGTSTDVDAVNAYSLWDEFSLTAAGGAIPQVAAASGPILTVGDGANQLCVDGAGNAMTLAASVSPAGTTGLNVEFSQIPASSNCPYIFIWNSSNQVANPQKGFFEAYSSSDFASYQYTLTRVGGSNSRIYTITLATIASDIELSNLPAGIYYLQVWLQASTSSESPSETSDYAIPGMLAFATDGAGNVTYTGGWTGNITGNLTGDIAGKVLGGGSSSITGVGASVADTSGTTTLLSRITAAITTASAQTTYQTALLNAINAITTNTSRSGAKVPMLFVIPSTGTQVYEILFYTWSLQGAPEAPDASPTIHATDPTGTSLDSKLSSTTMSAVAGTTNAFKVTYTVSSTDTQDSAYFAFTYAVNSVAMNDAGVATITTLNSLTAIGDIQTKVDSIAAGTTPVTATLATSQPNYAPLLASNYTAPNNAGIASASSNAATAATAATAAQTAADTAATAAAATQSAVEALPDASDIAGAVRDVDNSSPASGSLGAKVNAAAAGGGGGGSSEPITIEDGSSVVVE